MIQEIGLPPILRVFIVAGSGVLAYCPRFPSHPPTHTASSVSKVANSPCARANGVGLPTHWCVYLPRAPAGRLPVAEAVEETPEDAAFAGEGRAGWR